jgi:hypothetical protein
MNVCHHNTKLTWCADIGSRYVGLHSSKHLKCVHLEFEQVEVLEYQPTPLFAFVSLPMFD